MGKKEKKSSKATKQIDDEEAVVENEGTEEETVVEECTEESKPNNDADDDGGGELDEGDEKVEEGEGNKADIRITSLSDFLSKPPQTFCFVDANFLSMLFASTLEGLF